MYRQHDPSPPPPLATGLSFISAGDPASPTKGSSRVTGLPVHRSILAVDIENSTCRTNPMRQALRSQIYRLLDDSLRGAGIGDRDCDPFQDRGDGALVLIHPVDHIPKPLLLTQVVPRMCAFLCAYNRSLRPEDRIPGRLRIRVVIHAGEVHYDVYGPFGESVDIACRLLDAPKVKTCLRRSAAPLVLVISDYLHSEIVRHQYDGIEACAFAPMVNVLVGERRQRGWVCLPDITHLPAEAALAA